MESFRYYPAFDIIQKGDKRAKGTLTDFLALKNCRTPYEQFAYFENLCNNDTNIGFVNNASEIINDINEWINPSPTKISDNLIQGENKKVQ